MKIKYQIEYDEYLINKILLALFENMGDLTFLELSEILGKNYNLKHKDWKILKLHLIWLEDNDFLEERHFGTQAGDKNGIVDYSLEKKGMDRAKELQKIT